MAGLKEATSLLSGVPSVQAEVGPLGHHAAGLTVFTTAVFAVGEMAGSGVLALPSALKGTGYIGILLNVACALVSAYTAMLLGKCWTLVMQRSHDYKQHFRYPYPAIGQMAFGRFGRLVTSCSINVTLFGVSVVFLLLASDNLQSLVRNLGKDISFCYWLIIVAAVLCPISWLGTPKDFWPIAVGAVVSTSIACCLIVANIVLDGKTLQPATYPEVKVDSFFVAFGTICFAFGGHPAFPTFQTDMKEPEKFGRAIFIAYCIVLLMYLPVAICGYTVYGTQASDNILETISPGPMLYVVEVLITLHLFCGFIIVMNPVCQETEELLKIPTHFNIRRVILRTIMVALMLFVAESIPHFGAILSLIGGSTTTLLAYVLPPVFYLKLCSVSGDWDTVPVPLHEKVACIEIMIIGIVAGVASTYSAVLNLVTNKFSTPCYVNL